MKKRIAIQLFGHLRTYKKTFSSLKTNVISSNENSYVVDFFIHTWNELEHKTIAHHNQEKNLDDFENSLSKDILTHVQKTYNPRKIIIDNQLNIDELVFVEKLGAKRSIKGCINNSYTIFKVNELRQKYEKENNIKYDWVIQTRPDILFKTPFDIDNILDCYKQYNLPIPSNALYYAYNPFRGMGCEDWRWIAGSDLI